MIGQEATTKMTDTYKCAECGEDPGDIDNDDPLLVEGSDFGTGNEGP